LGPICAGIILMPVMNGLGFQFVTPSGRPGRPRNSGTHRRVPTAIVKEDRTTPGKPLGRCN